MATFDFKIIYTSDVHGQLTATQFADRSKALCGLTRIQTYLKHQKTPFLLLDNGDVLQGNVMLDHHREHLDDTPQPVSMIMKAMGYDYMTLGNHDFNYGFQHLKNALQSFGGKILCANVMDNDGQHVFDPYTIHTLKNGIKIGIIGAVTHYIPHWEKKENIKGLKFSDAYETIKAFVDVVRPEVDVLIVLYHGGFEKNLGDGRPMGRPTDENQGYKISQIPGIDILLTGHQHVPTVKHLTDGPLVLQTGFNASDFGEIDLTFKSDGTTWSLTNKQGRLLQATMDEDPDLYSLLENLENKTNQFLDEVIGKTDQDMTIDDPLKLRAQKHPLMQLMNDLQLKMSGADVSAASLPNQPIGLNKTITLRDLAANFIYPNTFVKLEITGHMLKQAIERSAEYYTSRDGVLIIDESFLIPKVEHYNVDVFDGIDYVIDARKPKGQRLVSCLYQNQPLKDHQKLSIVLNNYRAIGGGDYPMYEKATWLASYDITLFDLFREYIVKHPFVHVDVKNNFKVIY